MIATSIDQPVGFVEREPADWSLHHLGTFEDDRRAPSALGGVLEHRRSRREELPIQRRVAGTRIGLAGGALDSVEVDARERRGGEMADDRVEEALAAARLDVAQRGFRERAGSATTVDRLRENFALALGADFLGESSFRSACSFFNADAPEGAPDDPIGRFAALDEP